MTEENFQWAILYLPTSAASQEPFVVVPVIADTYLAAQSLIATEEPEENRFITYNETIAYNLSVSYRIYMFTHGTFFRSIFGMVEILNGFFDYSLTKIDPNMAVDTAYTLCTAIFPFTTKPNLGLHALLPASEIKAITKFKGPVSKVAPLRFEPDEIPEEDVLNNAKLRAMSIITAHLAKARSPPKVVKPLAEYVEGFQATPPPDPRQGAAPPAERPLDLRVPQEFKKDTERFKKAALEAEKAGPPAAAAPAKDEHQREQERPRDDQERRIRQQREVRAGAGAEGFFVRGGGLELELPEMHIPIGGNLCVRVDLDKAFEEETERRIAEVDESIEQLNESLEAIAAEVAANLQADVSPLGDPMLDIPDPLLSQLPAPGEVELPGEEPAEEPPEAPAEEPPEEPAEEPADKQAQPEATAELEVIAVKKEVEVVTLSSSSSAEADVAPKGRKRAPAKTGLSTPSRQPGPSGLATQVAELREEVKRLSGQLAKRKRSHVESDEEDDGDEKRVILPDPGMSRDAKFELIEAALPIDNDEALLNILHDRDGPELIEMALELSANRAIEKGKFTYDTSEKGNSVASHFVHHIFSKKYTDNFKLFDPRPNYVQREGTAMCKEVYEWFKNIVTSMAYSYHERNHMAGTFFWEAFYNKVRKVWRWSRGNEIRKQKKKEEKLKGKKKSKH